MDTYKEFNSYSCKEYRVGFERQGSDLEGIRRDYTGKRTKKT